jgi:putative transposase
LFYPNSAIKENGIYPKLAGRLKKAEQWPEAPKDSRLIFDKGRWFCLVPTNVAVTRSENQARVVAIDPGIRTFATLYAEDGAAKIGDGDYFAILRRCYALDDLISRMSKVNARKRCRLKKAANALRTRTQNLVSELHFKLARMLVNSFGLILLPTFETQAMARRHQRKI